MLILCNRFASSVHFSMEEYKELSINTHTLLLKAAQHVLYSLKLD